MPACENEQMITFKHENLVLENLKQDAIAEYDAMPANFRKLVSHNSPFLLLFKTYNGRPACSRISQKNATTFQL